jgi:FtsP/CotA-like multicopper oxidase with cupredoxin domain
MKTFILYTAFVFLNINVLFAQNNGKSLPNGSHYSCPMHPKIQNDTPGSCPICGMDLVKIKPQKAKPKKKAAPIPIEIPQDEIHIPIPEMKTEKQMIEKNQPVEYPISVKKKADTPSVPKIETSTEPPKIKPPRIVRYDLYVRDTTVNFTGKRAAAMAINGQIPAPDLYFTEGDSAVIYVHNRLKSPTSMHWHGIILPNQYDGVSYLTTSPILPNTTHLFTFRIVQNGTYWYHAHDLTEQIGLYGAFVIHKKENDPAIRSFELNPEHIILLSDWSNENPVHINRRLHVASDWYSIKKHSTQNYAEAILKGHLGTKLTNEWKRMLPMDVSDIAYNCFLINGKITQNHPQHKNGEKVRIRLINGGSSSYFWVQYASGKMTVIASDGKDVEPVEVDRLIIGNGETYDIILSIPDNGMSYELKATPEDRTWYTNIFFGSGIEMTVPEMPKLNYFEGMKMMNNMMDMSGNMHDMGMKMSVQKMDMNSVMYPELTGDNKTNGAMDMNHKNHETMPDVKMNDLKTLNYTMLRATEKTTLPNAPIKELRFVLTGNMNRYVWTMDNKTMAESDMIPIKYGQNVRIILQNSSMMRHPMHLHGHFFRVLNGQGDYAPLKHTLDIMPMETDTIEFAATEPGDWMFHCHILYHMAAGMSRVFSYENAPPNPEIPDHKKAMKILNKGDRAFYTTATLGLESNGSDGEVHISNTRWAIETKWHLGLNDRKGYESISHIGRFIGKNQFFMPYVGFDYRYRTGENTESDIFRQSNRIKKRRVATLGFHYTLPMFLLLDARIDHTGNVRAELSREDIALTSRLRLNLMANSDREYMIGGRYILRKWVSLSSHYDSDMGFGAGLTIVY